MKRAGWKMLKSCICTGILTLIIFGCAAQRPGRKAELQVIPERTFLSPALMKKPIQFEGSGFESKEMVVVEMVLPPGVKVKTVPEGENIGLAHAFADDKGNLITKMAPTATLNWFFQVGWTPNMKPDFSQAKPLPPGEYRIVATGMDSEVTGEAVLELIPPPKQK